MKKTYFLTIGQAPRPDIATSFDLYFKEESSVVWRGLLDDLTYQEAQKLYGKTAATKTSLTTTFKEGHSLVMDHQKVEAGLQKLIRKLKDAALICILCTGSFNQLQSKEALLLRADEIITEQLKDELDLGFLLPLKEQIPAAQKKWQVADRRLFQAVSPYNFSQEAAQLALKNLQERQVKTIVMDCIGFNQSIERRLKELAPEIHFILANELVFAYVKQLLN
ncbi:MAG TPA: AroM family protein [Tetragenococcus sp.]|nr:AroM family protein [Tetragenococcus sp.]